MLALEFAGSDTDKLQITTHVDVEAIKILAMVDEGNLIVVDLILAQPGKSSSRWTLSLLFFMVLGL